MSMVEFVQAGKELGYEGKELREWAQQQLHEFKAFEREKLEHERESKKLEHERELESKRLDHERELELIKEKKNLLSLEKKETSKKSHDAPRHRFPIFNEKIDDLDSFFQAFECQAKLLHVDDSELKSYLLSSLSGKAREIFKFTF